MFAEWYGLLLKISNTVMKTWRKLVWPAEISHCLKKLKNTRCSSFAVVFGLLLFFFKQLLLIRSFLISKVDDQQDHLPLFLQFISWFFVTVARIIKKCMLNLQLIMQKLLHSSLKVLTHMFFSQFKNKIVHRMLGWNRHCTLVTRFRLWRWSKYCSLELKQENSRVT